MVLVSRHVGVNAARCVGEATAGRQDAQRNHWTYAVNETMHEVRRVRELQHRHDDLQHARFKLTFQILEHSFERKIQLDAAISKLLLPNM